MPCTLYIVRHGEGEHNAANSRLIRDARLTPLGQSQCLQLGDRFPHHEEISVIMTSPLVRAVQTGILAFSPALRNPHLPFLVVPQAQEISGFPCDVGQDRGQIELELSRVLSEDGVDFDVARIDFSLFDDEWNEKKGQYEATLRAVEDRAAALRLWLWRRPEAHVVLVTHGSFIHYLMEDWTGYDMKRGTSFENCEFRTFTFSEDSNEFEARLVETGKTGAKIGRPRGANSAVLAGIETFSASGS